LSPILVRPVREQLEHDRVIRLLQAKYKRKFEVAINPGNEQSAPVGAPESPWFPDVVLQSAERKGKLAGVIEVETTESVNNLEAMSQWGALSRLRVPFHLYVPAGSVDTARRLCAEFGIEVAELWAYTSIGDQLRFTVIQRSAQAAEPKPRAAEPAAAPAPPAAPATARPRAASTPRPAATRTKPNGAGGARPARRAAPAAATKRRPPANKSKAAAPRRAAKSTARKPAASSRAQKRR
jgi:hypothetical protein